MIGKEIPDNVPIFVNLPDYFLMHYSVSGYVQKSLPNVHFIGHVLKSGGSNGFICPDHFVLVSLPVLGRSRDQKNITVDIRKQRIFV